VLIFRADERRRESGPTKLAPNQTALAVGPCKSSFLIMRLIDDGSECNFLDKAVVGSRPFGD